VSLYNEINDVGVSLWWKLALNLYLPRSPTTQTPLTQSFAVYDIHKKITGDVQNLPQFVTTLRPQKQAACGEVFFVLIS